MLCGKPVIQKGLLSGRLADLGKATPMLFQKVAELHLEKVRGIKKALYSIRPPSHAVVLNIGG
jgi:hypothetical protein